MYYGWRVVAGAFIAQFFFVGFFSYSVSLLTPALQAEFAVSLEQVMYGMTIGTFAGLVVSPLAGALVDRVSVRLLMSIGTLVFAGGLLLMARSESITTYVWAFGLTMALANGLSSSIPSMAVVSRWFHSNRGKALGIASISTSLGGVVLPALIRWSLETVGWRMTLDYLALCVLAIMLPAVILLIRNRPQDVGLLADGESQAAAPESPGPSAVQVLRMVEFWSLSLSLGLTFAGYAAVLANLAPFAVSAGLGDTAGSDLIIMVAVCGLIGKLAFGALADQISLKHGLWIAQGLAMLAFGIFASLPPYWLALAGAGAMGLAAGGLLPVWGALMAKVFGLQSYGMAMGMMMPIITLCTLPMFVVVGRLVDTSGSFQAPMQLFVATTFAAALCLLFLRMPAPAEVSAPDGGN